MTTISEPEFKSKLLNTKEAAACLGLKTSTLAKWRCQQTHPELEWVNIGARCFYKQETILSFIDKNTTNSINKFK